MQIKWACDVVICTVDNVIVTNVTGHTVAGMLLFKVTNHFRNIRSLKKKMTKNIVSLTDLDYIYSYSFLL